MFWVELIASAFRVFAQRQQIEFEDFVNLGHLVTAKEPLQKSSH